MGWVDEEETGGSRFPVDEFVRKLQDALGDIDSTCHGYSGQVRKCCDGARNCFTDLEDSLASMKLAAIGNQSMHKACRTLSATLLSANSCLTESTLGCHWSVDTQFIIDPFHATVDGLEMLKEEHCSHLPPEITTVRVTTLNTTTEFRTTTTPTTTPVPPTTSTAAATTTNISYTTVPNTTTSERTTNIITTTTLNEKRTTSGRQTNPTTVSKQRQETTVSPVTEKHTVSSKSNAKSTTPATKLTTTSRSNFITPLTTSTTGSIGSTNSTLNVSRQKPNSENTIIIVAAVIGVLLVVALLILFLVIRKRTRDNENTDSVGSFESDQNRKSTLLRRLFPRTKTKPVPPGDNEIYAEIDDAFMEAVYKCGNENMKPKKEILRERLSSNTQVNVCYEATFDDNIIDSKDSIMSNSLGDQSISMVSLNPLAFIRQDDDAITSFQMDQTNDFRQNAKPIPNHKKIVISKPSFTDIRSNEPDYVYIDACANEPIYAVPSNEENEYDTADYGRNPSRDISQAPETIYSSVNEYKNIDNTVSARHNDHIRDDTVSARHYEHVRDDTCSARNYEHVRDDTGSARHYEHVRDDTGSARNYEHERDDTDSARNYEHVRFKEYRRSMSNVDINIYENEDTMMEY